ncbi:MAG: T9SS type A sorting domain-containing protein [Aureispira sp.]|nr:T9SS type A sorting domain-containing protein [Aureispira sp.]
MKQLFTLFIFSLISFSSISATEYYWKGGSGDFNDPNMWWLNSFSSGLTALQAPISVDNVHFTAAAFTAPGAIVTISTNANCDTMLWDNNIVTANAPTVTASGNIYLDIYGSFIMAENMTFNYLGFIRFRSTRPLEGILTHSHKLKLRNIEFSGSDTTEWRLLDDLDCSAGHVYYGNIGIMNGTLNTDGYTLSMGSMTIPANANRSSGLDISNSRVYINGNWTTNVDTTTFSTFNTTGSHIYMINDVAWFNSVTFYGGTGLDYDTVTCRDYALIRSKTPYFQHLFVEDDIMFYYGNNSIAENLYVANGKHVKFYHFNNSLTVETIHINNVCGHFVVFETIPRAADVGTLRKKSFNNTLALQQSILQGINCDISNSRSYVANGSIDGGGNSPNWTINPPSAKDMYFRATTDNHWGNPANWQIWTGTMFVPNLGCIPTPADNVFFDDLSFPGADSVVVTDSIVYCHNMTWELTVEDSASILLADDAYIFGSLMLAPNMRDIADDNTVKIYFEGSDPDTITTNGIAIWPEMYMDQYSFYYIADDLEATFLNGALKSRIHAKNISMTLAKMTLDTGFYDSVYAELSLSGWNAFNGGWNMLYTGNTTFEFSPDDGVQGSYFGPTAVAPNVILNKHFLAYGYNTNVTIQGDLRMNEGNSVYYSGYNINVTGTMPLYNGDMYVTKGMTYTFNHGSLTVAGTLHSIGDCVETVNWSMVGSGFNVNFGATNIQHNFIRGWHNTGALITANNSIDAGDNINVDFPATAGIVYYWRADATAPTDFVGDWNNPNHWTTNEADITGTLGGCLPTLADTVVFDSMSFTAASNGCDIVSLAYCGVIITKDSIILNGTADFYIARSIIFDPTTKYEHTGRILIVGDGVTNILDTRNVYIKASLMRIDNAAGIWNILSPLRLRGTLYQQNGDLYTNTHDLEIGGYFHYGGLFDMRNTHVYVPRIMIGHTAWQQRGGTLLTDDSYLEFDLSYYYLCYFRMGDNQQYNRVQFKCYNTNGNNQDIRLYDNAKYVHADFVRQTWFYGNNYFDSLTLHGDQFYYMKAGNTQTLASPHGKILTDNVGPGQFISIESQTAGQKAYFHKEYGSAFCIDWVKVKDNEATKGTPVAPWIDDHPYLQFETGENSDNINGTATGIWAFNLAPILTVVSSHADTVDFCTGDTTVYVPITMTGTYPYSIIYSWTDIWGNTGIDTIIDNDDDNDVFTPHTYNLALNPWTTTDYTIDVAAIRCGGRNFGAPIKPLVMQLPKNPIVTTDRTGSCLLTNNSVWSHFMDDVDQKPMLSILDSTNVTDNDALGLVNVQTNFDATVQWWNGKPYLPRHWKVDAANATGGHVRLYFTQADLDKLGLLTYNGLAPIVSSELILWKFDDTITVGTPTQIPFTEIPLTGRAADPFSTTAAVYAIEFEVSGFSGFMLQPTDLGLLPLELLSFEATAINNSKIELDWATEQEKDVSHFVVERSTDGVSFEEIGQLSSSLTNVYQFLDSNPLHGVNYYRLRIVSTDNTFTYSDISSAEIKGANLVEIRPNPVTEGELTIRVLTAVNSELQVNIINAIGQSVVQQKATVQSNSMNTIQVDVQELSAGMYTLQLIDGEGQVQTKQFIIR